MYDHGFHPHVMHGNDAASHYEAANGDFEPVNISGHRNIKRDEGGNHADEHRHDGQNDIVSHIHIHVHRQHADKMHGPNAASHDHGPAE